MSTTPAGYRLGDPALPASPVTADELELLKATLLWTDADDAALRRAGAAVADRVEEILDVWYGFVGANPHLLASFSDADGAPIGPYLDAVRRRFARWILDTCRTPYDRSWLDYQHEIALRHHATGKNRTDGVASSPEVALRYLIAFVVPLTVTMRPFLAEGAADAADLEAMHAAWFKAVTLTAALWARPYSASW